MDLKILIDVAQTILLAGVSLWIWAANRRAAQKREVDRAFATLFERLTIAEQGIKHGPSQDDLGAIHKRLDALAEELHHIAGEFEAVRRTLDLIHQAMLRDE